MRASLISFVTFLIVIFVFNFVHFAEATVTVTPATGGSAISADTTGGAYTSLTGPIIAEGATADIGTGGSFPYTLILNVPSGFVFDISGTAPTVLVTRTAGNGTNTRNINSVASGTSVAITSITSSQITFTVSNATSNGVTNSLTWQNVRVRPSAGTPLTSGNMTTTGTISITGVTNGVTNLGTLTEVVGAKSQLVITTQPSASATVATDFGTKPVVAVRDQFGNTVTSDSATTITRTAVLSTQVCGGTAGSGTLSSTPASGAAVSLGVMTYTAMQYSVAESIKICFSSSGITSALSNVVTVSAPSDTTAPAAISNLTLSGATSNSINLSWTAPGDDGSTGTATSYDIRYSTSIITAGNFSSTTAVSGAPTPQIAGTSQLMTVSGLSSNTIYFFTMKTSDEVPNTSAISNVPSLATLVSGGGIISPASVVTGAATANGGALSNAYFYGQAYPGSKIEVLRRSEVTGPYESFPFTLTSVKEDGAFQINIQNFLQAGYFLAIRVTDSQGRQGRVLPLISDFVPSGNNITIKDIFVPPTIEIKEGAITRGGSLKVVGFSAPTSSLEFVIDDKIKGTASSSGNGFYEFTTSIASLADGDHFIKTRTINFLDKTSDFSLPRTFRISPLTFPRADFNSDNIINIADWSMFLFRWASEDKNLRSSIDLNQDGKVDLADFGIFLNAIKTL